MSSSNNRSVIVNLTGGSPFEKLPAEIRHNVYSYLEYPVGRHMYEDCKDGQKCKYKTHIVFHEDERWPMWAHAYDGVFENRVQVAQLKFGEGTASSSPFKSLSYQIEDPNNAQIYKRLDIDTGLLGVNRSIRDELLSLLFDKLNVSFIYPMSNQAIYLGSNVPDEAIHQPLRILPSTLAYITSITYASEDSSVRSSLPGLELEADTIKFFAKHCRYLTQFKYLPDQEEILDCRDGYLGSLSQAPLKLIRSCRKLETLKIEYVESLICTNEQGNIDKSTSRVVKELAKEQMTRVSGWSFRILEHLQGGAEVYEN